MDTLFGLVVFGGFGLMLLGFVLQSRKRNAQQAAGDTELHDLALARGMQFEIEDAKRGQPTQVRLTDRAQGVILRLTPAGPDKRLGQVADAELTLHQPSFPGGLALYADQKDPQLSRAISVLAGAVNNPVGRLALGKLLGGVLGPDVLDNLGDLQPFDPADGTALLILASIDPRGWFDTQLIAQTIQDGPRDRKTNAPRSIITISASGTVLRSSPVPLTREGLARFLDLGLRLQAAMAKR